MLPVSQIGGVVGTVRILTPISVEKVGQGIFVCKNLTLQAEMLIRNEREADGRGTYICIERHIECQNWRAQCDEE